MARVALLLPNLEGGGAEVSALRLAHALRRMGDEVTVVVGEGRGPLTRRLGGLRAVELGAGSMMAAVRPLARFLREERPDVVIGTMVHASAAGLLAAWVSGWRGLPILWVHASPGHERSWRGRIAERLVHRGLPAQGRVVCVNAASAAEVAAAWPALASRIHTIPNLVHDPEGAAPVTKPATMGPPIVLGAGRLVPDKDFGALIDAVARLDRLVRLVICGEGPARDGLLAQAASRGVLDRVVLPGFVDDLPARMAEAAVFVHPSRHEIAGLVLDEAHATGLPVVATDSGPRVREAVRRWRGWVVPVGDVPALASAIDAALDAGARRRPVTRDESDVPEAWQALWGA